MQAAEPGASNTPAGKGSETTSASHIADVQLSPTANGDGQQPDEPSELSLEAARKAEKARKEAKAGSGAGAIKGQQAQVTSQNSSQQQVSFPCQENPMFHLICLLVMSSAMAGCPAFLLDSSCCGPLLPQLNSHC